jgi:hypothetical protein
VLHKLRQFRQLRNSNAVPKPCHVSITLPKLPLIPPML